MIRKRLLIPIAASLGTLTLCLVPFPFLGNGTGHYEPSLFVLAHRLAAMPWVENARKHTALLLHTIVHPRSHSPAAQIPPAETAKADAAAGS